MDYTEFYNQEKRQLVYLKWIIEGYENYCFATDKRCYNRKTRREVKRKLKAYTQGYYFNSQFVSLKKIRPLLQKV